MDVEDDILAEQEDLERRIAGKDQALEENARALEEKDRLIAELRQL